MRLILGTVFLLGLLLVNLSFTFEAAGPGPKKKIYRDTIYRFKTKPVAGQNNSRPVVKTTKPVEKTLPKPVIPKLPEIAEEDRLISIYGEVTKFVVKKSAQKMYVYFADTFKVYKISLGANPTGNKVKQGDNRTPEGTYYISFKNPNSRGYRSLKISYPNEDDRQRAIKAGVNPGGDIFIHGLWWNTQDPNNHWKDNWTRGCIAVNNTQIEEIFNHTPVNTPITIMP